MLFNQEPLFALCADRFRCNRLEAKQEGKQATRSYGDLFRGVRWRVGGKASNMRLDIRKAWRRRWVVVIARALGCRILSLLKSGLSDTLLPVTWEPSIAVSSGSRLGKGCTIRSISPGNHCPCSCCHNCNSRLL